MGEDECGIIVLAIAKTALGPATQLSVREVWWALMFTAPEKVGRQNCAHWYHRCLILRRWGRTMASFAGEGDRVESKGETLDPLWYFVYAGADGDAWGDIVGRRVTHWKYGSGRVMKVTPRDGSPSIIRVRFVANEGDRREREFLTSSFGDGMFTELVLPNDLAGLVQRDVQRRQAEQLRRKQEELERRRQLALEARDRRHFAEMKRKYGAVQSGDDSPVSPLYRILLLLEDGDLPGAEDILWLEQEHLDSVVAIVREREYERTQDLWSMVKASSKWQDAGNHERALGLTCGVTASDPKLMGALLTTRGRAYRHLRDLDQAEQCARDAIALNPTSFYAYNLLGAIYYQRGYPEDGDEQFQKALELGASDAGTDREIEAAVRIADRQQQRDVARFLLSKDASRYRWAEHYL
jgi:tetratricopeptide (TPR) repeat protein